MERQGNDAGADWRPAPAVAGQWRLEGALGIDLGSRRIKLFIPPGRLARAARRRAPAGLFGQTDTPKEGPLTPATSRVLAALLAAAPLCRQPLGHPAILALPTALTRQCVWSRPRGRDPVTGIRQLRTELARHLDLPVADGAVDFIESNATDAAHVRVVAARREAVDGIARVGAEAGMRPVAVDAAGFALERLAALHAGEGPLAVVDLGAEGRRVALARAGDGLGHLTVADGEVMAEPEGDEAPVREALQILEMESGRRAEVIVLVGGGTDAARARRLARALARPCRPAGFWASLWLAWTLSLRRESP